MDAPLAEITGRIAHAAERRAGVALDYAETAALVEYLGVIESTCPIADLPLVQSLLAEKWHAAEHAAALSGLATSAVRLVAEYREWARDRDPPRRLGERGVHIQQWARTLKVGTG